MTYRVRFTTRSGISWTDPRHFDGPRAALRHAARVKRPAGVRVAVRPHAVPRPCDHPSIDLDTLVCVECDAKIPTEMDIGES